ncbi:hypothetical protein BDW68DRAFT_35707 [Aspergillus falconensis]
MEIWWSACPQQFPSIRTIPFLLHPIIIIIIIWLFGYLVAILVTFVWNWKRRADLSSWGHRNVAPGPRPVPMARVATSCAVRPSRSSPFVPEKLPMFCRSHMQFVSALKNIFGLTLET